MSDMFVDAHWLVAGCLDIASAAWFFAPGKYIIWKLYLSVCSLILRSRLLGMSFRHRSDNILSRGLWSTATISLGHPSTKYLVFSKLSATARASPSIGAYLDSAGWVKRLPIRVVFQPVLQHSGVISAHLQCFCCNQYPMPSLDQSVVRHVCLPLSNMVTPCSISLMIVSLESWKSASRVFFHSNGRSVFCSWRRGFTLSVMLKVYDTWFIKPNHDPMLVLLLGEWNSAMAWVYFSWVSRCSW